MGEKNVRIVPLKEAGSVDEVLDEFLSLAEARFGNVKEMIEPLRGDLQGKKLDGWAVLHDKVLGFVVSGEREGSGRINFVHVLSSQDKELLAILIKKAADELRRKGATRITSEALIVRDETDIQETFRELGFQVLKRMFMSLDVKGLTEVPVPVGYTLISWDDTYIEKVGELLYDANLEGLDRMIYPELKSVEGATRMVRTLRNGPASPFDEKASTIAVCNGVVVGAVLFCRISPDQGFVAEMAVARAHQGKKLGKALLAKSLSTAHKCGIKTVGLGVTEDNLPAMNLYRTLGFTSKRRVYAYIWEN